MVRFEHYIVLNYTLYHSLNVSYVILIDDYRVDGAT